MCSIDVPFCMLGLFTMLLKSQIHNRKCRHEINDYKPVGLYKSHPIPLYLRHSSHSVPLIIFTLSTFVGYNDAGHLNSADFQKEQSGLFTIFYNSSIFHSIGKYSLR